MNWWRLTPAVLCVGALAADIKDVPRGADAPTGVIAGVVRYTGKVPDPQKITTTDGAIIEHHDLVVDAKSKGLRHVFAVLDEAPAQAKLAKAKPVLVDQRDMLFLPRVVAVQHGQPVRFENNDICNHSVAAHSTVKANQFNQIAGSGTPIEHTFELQKRPIVPVQIGCSLHGWMRSWVYVAPHPWFAVSDEKGTFRIEAVRPGKHTLVLTHADTGLQDRREVQVEAGKTAEVAVEWEKVK